MRHFYRWNTASTSCHMHFSSARHSACESSRCLSTCHPDVSSSHPSRRTHTIAHIEGCKRAVGFDFDSPNGELARFRGSNCRRMFYLVDSFKSSCFNSTRLASQKQLDECTANFSHLPSRYANTTPAECSSDLQHLQSCYNA
jgi:hypothetical protein